MIAGVIDRVLGERIAVYNGVAVRDRRGYHRQDHYPGDKALLTDTIAEHVTDGDHVVEVGGGRGVCTVHAARQGSRVRVTTYEPAREMYGVLKETLELNDVSEQVTVHAQAVGPVIEAYGSTENVDSLDPRDLPHADVYVLDCEGGERYIAEYLPDDAVKIVETHPAQKSTTERIRELIGGDIVGADPVDGDVIVA